MTTPYIYLAQLSVDHNTIGLPRVDASNANLVNILNGVFIVIGAAAVMVIVLAGITYVTSNGDARKIQGAKDAILYAIVGIIVSISAFAIVQFVVGWI